jgi:magnesium transporter
MLSAYLFDQRQGESVAAWADAVQHLAGSQVLWLDLLDISDAEELEVQDALGLEDLEICGAGHEIAALTQREDYLEVTAVCVAESEDGSAPQPAAINCFVGENWVLTSHAVELALIDEFRERTEGQGEIGVLDAPSFLASLLGSVVTISQRAFDKIEMDLEEFDLEALRSLGGDAERRIGVLVDVRRQVGALRRSLVPHREVFVALSQREFDPVSTEQSAKRFNELAVKTDAALAAALDAKNAIAGSFDVVIARRTPYQRDHEGPRSGIDPALARRPHRRSDGNECELQRKRFRGVCAVLGRGRGHRAARRRNTRYCPSEALDLAESRILIWGASSPARRSTER